jgi:hypothetical protein
MSILLRSIDDGEHSHVRDNQEDTIGLWTAVKNKIGYDQSAPSLGAD